MNSEKVASAALELSNNLLEQTGGDLLAAQQMLLENPQMVANIHGESLQAMTDALQAMTRQLHNLPAPAGYQRVGISEVLCLDD